MPKLEEFPFDGFYEKVKRLGLDEILEEMRGLLAGFDLRVLEKKDANGGAAVRMRYV